MADNYLERRMEELRSGQLAVKGGVPGIRPGSLRVLILGGTKGEGLEKVLEYRKKGYRVAVFDSDEKAGKRMAYENGIRFHRVDLADDDAIEKETEALLKAWRGIDVVVGEERLGLMIGQQISQWRKSMPIPDLSDVKVVIIKNDLVMINHVLS